MIIKEINIFDFRNYQIADVGFHEKINIIRGGNGQGKTNLLEAVSILSMGKSFRTKNDTEMIRFNSEYFKVKGLFLRDDREMSIEMRLSRGEKGFIIDGIHKKRNAELLEHVYTVVFSPEDLKIVKEDPDKRRRFLDRELFQLKPLYYKELARYKKALRNRNNLLKAEHPDWELISVYDVYMAESGARVMSFRNEFIEKLNVVSGETGGRISGGKEKLCVLYDSNVPFFPSSSDMKEALIERYNESRERDNAAGSTSAGPHRDDIKIMLGGEDLRKYGSQGQQRTAALALKLAELKIIKEETGVDAILLLDDVLSELDHDRQNFLIRSFEENQILLTAADLSEKTLNALPRGKMLEVKNGEVFDTV